MPSNSSFKLILILILIKTGCLSNIRVLANSNWFTPSQPVLWYNFEDEGATVVDQSGNGLYGTLVGAVTRNAGILEFSGEATDYIETPHHDLLAGTGNFTVAFNIRFDRSIRNPAQLIINGEYGYYVGYQDGSLNLWRNNLAANDIGLAVENGSFHQLVVVYANLVADVYCDKQLVATVPVPRNYDEVNSIFFGKYFCGAYNAIKLFNTALNRYQVKSIFDPDHIAPSAPQNLSGQATSATSTELAWSAASDNIGVAGYEIYRNGTCIDTTSSLSYTDSGLGRNQNYVYRVVACDYYGNQSSESNSITIPLCDTLQMNIPENTFRVCNHDTLVLEVALADSAHTYSCQWQELVAGSWINIVPGNSYSNTHTTNLNIQNTAMASLPKTFRLAAQNRCGTTYSDSLVVSPETQYSLSGQVFCGTEPLPEGSAFLYKTQYPSIPFATTPIINGEYVFSTLCPGSYYLKAHPLGEALLIYADRYYSDVFYSAQPTELNIYTHLSHVIIDLIPTALTISATRAADFSIAPTLVTNYFTLQWATPLQLPLQVQVVNLLGKTVHQIDIPTGSSEQRIDLPHLPSGAYYVQLNIENNRLPGRKIMVNQLR